MVLNAADFSDIFDDIFFKRRLLGIHAQVLHRVEKAEADENYAYQVRAQKKSQHLLHPLQPETVPSFSWRDKFNIRRIWSI